MVERRSSGPHLDLFGRRDRPGWVVWGDEAPEITEEINHTTLTDEAYVIDNNDIHGAPI
jgi:N6-adenosine-specific RNA methylase IME4